MNIRDLKLREPEVETRTIKLDSGVDLDVRTYLPIDAKADLITWIITMATDDKTGCISPVRFEVCFAIGVVQRYAGIEIDEGASLTEVYDLLESNDVINMVMGAIPEEEFKFLQQLAEDTAKDVERYNNSFAGMIGMLTSDASNIDSQLTTILQKIRDKEGLEQLSVIRDVVGTD